MRKLDVAISVAADYAYHLYKEDGVPKDKAIAAGVSAVVRAARQNGTTSMIPSRRKHHAAAQPAASSGMGLSAETMLGVGSLISAAGWIKRLVVGG